MFEEVLDDLNAKNNDYVHVKLADKPSSVGYIIGKLRGKELSLSHMKEIVSDIIKDNLTDIELTAFVSASFAHGLSDHEIANLTKAMIDSWAVHETPIKNPVQDYSPTLAAFNHDPYGRHHAGGASKSDYENYLWLFGGKR